MLDEGDGSKVKRIDVLPGKRLSYQKHLSRAEQWMIVEGVGMLTVEGHETVVKPGDTADIPVRDLGEDDIIRLQDDFGTVPEEVVKT